MSGHAVPTTLIKTKSTKSVQCEGAANHNHCYRRVAQVPQGHELAYHHEWHEVQMPQGHEVAYHRSIAPVPKPVVGAPSGCLLPTH